MNVAFELANCNPLPNRWTCLT